MALEQLHLSEREQWAQSLKDNLTGMITFAEYLAVYFDSLDIDDLDHFLAVLLMSSGKGETWERALRIIRRWEKNLPEGMAAAYRGILYVKEKVKREEKLYDIALRFCRRQYKSLDEYFKAKKEVVITFLMREYSHSGLWD